MSELTASSAKPVDHDFAEAVIALFKGPVYRDTHQRPWQQLTAHRTRVSDYVAVVGLAAYIDEAEGFAFLRSIERDDEEDGLPRIIPRRRLSFGLSLLLVLLRRRLIEQDVAGGEAKVVISRDQIVDLLRVFLPAGSNDARLFDQIDAHIKKAVDLGFLRATKGHETAYEIRRILAAFVDAQWLADFDHRLRTYAAKFEEQS